MAVGVGEGEELGFCDKDVEGVSIDGGGTVRICGSGEVGSVAAGVVDVCSMES